MHYRDSNERPLLGGFKNSLVDAWISVVAEIPERGHTLEFPSLQLSLHIVQCKGSCPHSVIHIASLSQGLIGKIVQLREVAPELSPEIIGRLQEQVD